MNVPGRLLMFCVVDTSVFGSLDSISSVAWHLASEWAPLSNCRGCPALVQQAMYYKVDDEIETVWQAPRRAPKAILFVAHGCNHQVRALLARHGLVVP